MDTKKMALKDIEMQIRIGNLVVERDELILLQPQIEKTITAGDQYWNI